MIRMLLGFLFCITFISSGGEIQAGEPLTPQEQGWLKGRTLRVGVADYDPPFGFLDTTRAPQGIAVDYWRLLSSKFGFRVKFYPCSLEKQLGDLKRGAVDSLGGILPLKERTAFFDFSHPFATIRTFIYTRTDDTRVHTTSDLEGLKVAAVEKDSGQIIASRYRLNPISCTTYREAVFLLANGGADAIIMNEWTAEHLLYEHQLLGKIRKTGMPVEEMGLTLPVQKGNSALLRILNKAITYVSPEEWEQIKRRWLTR